MPDSNPEQLIYLDTEAKLFQRFPLIVELRPIRLPNGQLTTPQSYTTRGVAYLSSPDLARWKAWSQQTLSKERNQ